MLLKFGGLFFFKFGRGEISIRTRLCWAYIRLRAAENVGFVKLVGSSSIPVEVYDFF